MPVARIGFVLLSNPITPQPSTRVSVLNMLPHLRAAGFDVGIAHCPTHDCTEPDLSQLCADGLARRFDIIYFQKVRGPSVLQLARDLRSRGVRTIYGNCDLIEPGMTAETDASVVATEYLKSLHPDALHDRMHVVHDGIENPEALKPRHSEHRGSRRHPLRAVLVASTALTELPVLGSPPPWLRVTIVGRYPPSVDRNRWLRQIRWELAQRQSGRALEYLSFLLDRRIERIAWHPVGVYEQLKRADIGIIPIETRPDLESDVTPSWMIKTENRLTLKMAVGLPVVATPIPSYEPVVTNGVTAFFGKTRAEWMEHLEALRDPALRAAVGARARDSVLQRFSKARQAESLISVLRRVLDRPATATPR